MAEYLSGAYFEVFLAGAGAVLAGRFTAVSGLGMELEYETYKEGVVTDVDSVSVLMGMCNQGMSVPLAGTVILKDSFGAPQRVWNIVGAHLQKYMGPELDANQAAVAVSRIELLYNGCF